MGCSNIAINDTHLCKLNLSRLSLCSLVNRDKSRMTMPFLQPRGQ